MSDMPGPKFASEDGEGAYFCEGVVCPGCDGARIYGRFTDYEEPCETCDGEGWVLRELEGIEAVREAVGHELAIDALSAPPCVEPACMPK